MSKKSQSQHHDRLYNSFTRVNKHDKSCELSDKTQQLLYPTKKTFDTTKAGEFSFRKYSPVNRKSTTKKTKKRVTFNPNVSEFLYDCDYKETNRGCTRKNILKQEKRQASVEIRTVQQSSRQKILRQLMDNAIQLYQLSEANLTKRKKLLKKYESRIHKSWKIVQKALRECSVNTCTMIEESVKILVAQRLYVERESMRIEDIFESVRL